ncbi:Alpha/Beta hydrolase protein [Dendryphion nanum]|uniref:Alpha/Beta hydrolase protein n=1 Tax=Dendryphion nanum TaxID=256645 RepID=A0A9P9IPZ9_9PLEO|nr:Alpha/Beta hydrolase protein [Dendryphion nanum]
MPAIKPILAKSYWLLAVQRNILYSHKLHTAFWHNVSNPEEFGFAKGQVTSFLLNTSDAETLFCWHVLPLDVYLDNENEIVQKAISGEVVEDLKETVGYKLLKNDAKSKVVVNFHGNAGHLAQGHRPATYRSISGIPHTHLLTCDYRGFGLSTLNNAPHIPTETGIINDGISLISYILTTLKQPSSRIVLLGQSLGTAVTAASALHFTDPTSESLPTDLTPPNPAPKFPVSFAGIVLVAPFTTLPDLLETYRIGGVLPVLSPLRNYKRISLFLRTKILDRWPTLPRLQALLKASAAAKPSVPVHVTIIHARNDQDITFKLSEHLYVSLEQSLLGDENVMSEQERRSIHGGERVKRGAFAYRKVEDTTGQRTVELEIVRYGGHNQVVGYTQVALAVRRALKGEKTFRPGLDVE